MADMKIIEMTPDQLRDYVVSRNDQDFVLIDVRQPEEYERGHIPGARLIPLPDFESNLFKIPADREMLFYCQSGGRSAAAAMLAEEAEITDRRIYNLRGGMMAYDGQILTDYPKVRVFDKDKTLEALLLTAMNMEKGAMLFYRHVANRYAAESFAQGFGDLAKAEEAHARLVYRFRKKCANDERSFETCFSELKGDILESGANFDEALARLENFGDNICQSLTELALHIEYSAYDLYRALAEKVTDAQEKKTILSISQAEKEHMGRITRMIRLCE